MTPGKFKGNADIALAQRLYDVTMESGQIEDIGSVDEGGWYAWIEDDYGLDDMRRHYIAVQDSQGFFTVLEGPLTYSEAHDLWEAAYVTAYEAAMDIEWEPDEEDIYIGDDRGREVVSYAGKIILRSEGGEPVPYADIRAWMERSNYWPNVWRISDHGNLHLVNVYEED